MVNIQPVTTNETIGDEKPWLVEVDRRFNESITLDLTAFTATWLSADGKFVLSGVRLKKSGNFYVPALDADVTAGTYLGLLFDSIEKVSGATKSSAALMTHGVVRNAALPQPTVAAQQPLTPLIRYI